MLVLKFGGSSLSSPQQIIERAQQIARLHQQGHKITVIVSAMGNSTNKLVQMAYEVSPSPNRRELDMLLTTGERISMALLSMALNDLNVPAISFTGSQAGIMTEYKHNDAEIKELKPTRVIEELNKNKVVIVAGFQGVDPETKEVTTLGRGGSDSTAVAFAHFFKAKRCMILKDVPGVLDANPNFVKEAQPIEHLNYSQLEQMCLAGAQVLHIRAIQSAKKLQVPLFIALADNFSQGTIVNGENFNSNNIYPRSLNTLDKVYALCLKNIAMENSTDFINDFCAKHNIPSPSILFASANKTDCKIYLHAPAEIMNYFIYSIEHNENIDPCFDQVCSLSLTFSSPPTEDLIEKVKKISHTFKIIDFTCKDLNLNFFVDTTERDALMKELYRNFIHTRLLT